MSPSEEIAFLSNRVRELVALLDEQNGTPCAQIRWSQDRDELIGEIARLRAALSKIPKAFTSTDMVNIALTALKTGAPFRG
jgi:hypothetical protein